MDSIRKKNILFEKISTLKGVGNKIEKYLSNKKIEKVKDLLLDLPYGVTDRSRLTSLENLEIGKITTIQVNVKKYNFPRIRNLPSKVICSENNKKINIVFFNSREGYIKKVLPLNQEVVISGKVNFYRNEYQITNPTYIELKKSKEKLTQIYPKYSLTEGLKEKNYRKIILEVLQKINNPTEWYTSDFLKKNKFNSLKVTLSNLHNPSKKINIHSNDYKRMVYDEITSNLISLICARKIIRAKKKLKKNSENKLEKVLLKNFRYNLTKNQKEILIELENDINSDKRMLRLLQGDVGSGKTILALITAAKVIETNHQVAFMAPTEILANQHFKLAKELFSSTKVKIELITGKTHTKNKKLIISKIKNGDCNLVFGTHSLFQQNVIFFNLGFVIIDEQHKFGVKQRLKLAKKGGDNCDLLLISATPIPRTMMLSLYGDMDISRLKQKPKHRKNIITLIKPENKINELWPLIRKEISYNRQIFWVCPLINDSKDLNYSSVKNRFEYLERIFPNQVGLIYGSLDQYEKDKILKEFLIKKIKILISTTVIEVGIDFPNANTIIIDNSDKFGLSQLHQLRGRVGRGKNESICVLLYKKMLSNNAKNRLKVLRSTDDGFLIAEKDLEMRGFGDILGFQQSGIKNFRFADPIQHKDMFLLAEKNMKNIENKDIKKFETLLKLYDNAEIITEIAD